MSTDVYIIATITTIFVLLGATLPFIEFEFTGTKTVNGYNNLKDETGEADLSALDIFFSIFKMFFWTFGSLPWFIDMLFIILRVMLGYSIARTIRGV